MKLNLNIFIILFGTSEMFSLLSLKVPVAVRINTKPVQADWNWNVIGFLITVPKRNL